MKQQESHQAKAEEDKKAEGLAKMSISYEKVMEACSQLVTDVLAGEDDDDWTRAGDDEIRKAMQAKQEWVKRMADAKEDYMMYKTLVTTLSPEMLTDEESDFRQLTDHYELVKKTLEDALEAVEEEDTKRNLFTLDKGVTSKLEYPKFSGKSSECFFKFKEKME